MLLVSLKSIVSESGAVSILGTSFALSFWIS
jgi:hypothetical protein